MKMTSGDVDYQQSCLLSAFDHNSVPSQVPKIKAPAWLGGMWLRILAVIAGLVVGYWLIDDFNPDDMRGKRVIVTGASTGIGEQMAYHLAKMGANVLVTARRAHRLQEVVSKCREIGDGNFDYISADMSNLSSTEDVIREARSKMGGLDYLILNHIINVPLGLWEGSVENLTDMDILFDVNFKAYVHLTSHALPLLEKSHGSIVVVSSLSGKIAQPFTIAYSASKFALFGFFNGLRQELKMKNCDVSVTLCVMGFVGTENAIRELKNYNQDFLMKNFPPEKVEDAALAIIKGGATRTREVHFPYFSMKLVTMFRDLIPHTLEAFFRFVYQLNS